MAAVGARDRRAVAEPVVVVGERVAVGVAEAARRSRSASGSSSARPARGRPCPASGARSVPAPKPTWTRSSVGEATPVVLVMRGAVLDVARSPGWRSRRRRRTRLPGRPARVRLRRRAGARVVSDRGAAWAESRWDVSVVQSARAGPAVERARAERAGAGVPALAEPVTCTAGAEEPVVARRPAASGGRSVNGCVATSDAVDVEAAFVGRPLDPEAVRDVQAYAGQRRGSAGCPGRRRCARRPGRACRAFPVLKIAIGKSLRSLPKPTASSFTGRKVARELDGTRGPRRRSAGRRSRRSGDQRAAAVPRLAARGPTDLVPQPAGSPCAVELLADGRLEDAPRRRRRSSVCPA